MASGEKKKKKPRKTGASSGHITNLKQSILDFWYLWLWLFCTKDFQNFRSWTKINCCSFI